jgi:hypothetical protein
MELGAVAAEVATPVTLRENDGTTPPREETRPSREENIHTEDTLQVGGHKKEDTGCRNNASPVNEPDAHMMNRVGEEAMNRMTKEETETDGADDGHKDIHTAEGGDGKWRHARTGKGRTE